MSDNKRKFHDFALHSILFKGRSDWYFCYLKSEKIAHVLVLLSQKSAEGGGVSFQDLIASASFLPQMITRFVAEEVRLEAVLADLFGLLSKVRLISNQRLISRENAAILLQEYEQLAEKLASEGQLSPFLSSEDFSIPSLPEEPVSLPLPVIKDIPKGHSKGQQNNVKAGQNDRGAAILEMVRKSKGLSIKELSAVIKDVSEKTIQRELAALISSGLIRKQGERRWSIYLPV